MAWTTPRTWVTNEVVTAAIMNTHVRDNLNYLYSRPVCALNYVSGNQTIATATRTVLAFDYEETDPFTMHDPTTNNSRVTIPTGEGGMYLIQAHTAWDASAAGIRQMMFRENGSTSSYYGGVTASGDATNGCKLDSAVIRFLGAGTYVEVEVWHDAGVNAFVLQDYNSPRFAVARLA